MGGWGGPRRVGQMCGSGIAGIPRQHRVESSIEAIQCVTPQRGRGDLGSVSSDQRLDSRPVVAALAAEEQAERDAVSNLIENGGRTLKAGKVDRGHVAAIPLVVTMRWVSDRSEVGRSKEDDHSVIFET